MTIKKLFFSILFLSVLSVTTAQETKWNIDKSHSSIAFEISHFKIATVKGNFDDFSGSINAKDEDFSKANVDFTIQATSINTNQEDRDKHLRSADFFNVEQNPEITFKSTSFSKKSDKEYSIKGDLTVNGITEPFEFIGTFKGSFLHPRFKKTIGVFEFTGSLPRLKYNIGTKYPTAALGENVKISVNVEMIKEE